MTARRIKTWQGTVCGACKRATCEPWCTRQHSRVVDGDTPEHEALRLRAKAELEPGTRRAMAREASRAIAAAASQDPIVVRWEAMSYYVRGFDRDGRLVAEYANAARELVVGVTAAVWADGKDAAMRTGNPPFGERIDWCEQQLRSAHDAAASAQPKAASELPPGWNMRADCELSHVSNIGIRVFPSYADDWFWKNVDGDGYAPTRDEAMACALGWMKLSEQEWELPGAPNGMSASISSGGAWYAINARSEARPGFPSLPHAIAWAMGHEA